MQVRSHGERPRRHWTALIARVARLFLRQPAESADLVRDSYDRIAGRYDQVWTSHMRDLSVDMLDRLVPPAGARCIDLGCGTGFITSALAERTAGRPVGVDASSGMLAGARRRHGAACDFVHADMLKYLQLRKPCTADVITCGWSLGYSRPLAVVRQISRVLAPGGKIGIIDNSLASLAGVLWSSLLAFAERPEALSHVLKLRFLPNSLVLAGLMRACGLGVGERWDGSKTYYVADGTAAIDRLQATGAAAGFEFAVGPTDRDAIFARFAEILAARSAADDGIAITHRYIAAVGGKPWRT